MRVSAYLATATLILFAGCAGSPLGLDISSGPGADLVSEGEDGRGIGDGQSVPDCDGKECGAKGCEEGEPCDDLDPCTQSDLCTGGVCEGIAYECNDDKECTQDECDGAGECDFVLKSGKCLINGICYDEGTSHSAQPCSECMTAVSKTAWTNDDTNECFDTNECTVGDYCLDGECESGTDSLMCDDGNSCTGDACDPDQGCVFVPVEGGCDDADLCTSGDHCADGECVGEEVPCNDGNICTDDWCDQQVGCSHSNSDGECDDGNHCTVGDFCADGECQPGPTPMNCDDDNACTDDSCTPLAGCSNVNNSGPCNDGDLCTVGDFCAGGVCQPGGGIAACNDNNDCTADSCDPKGGCLYAPMDGDCDDGSVCTTGDHCEGGVCQPGSGITDCDDQNLCTTDSCDPQAGCQHELNAAPCSDGNECTDDDHCDAGICMGQLKVCNDQELCTTDTCNPLLAGGCVFTPNGLQCEDGDPCTLGDNCGSGTCQPGMGQLDCDDGNECTADTCVPGDGCKNSNAVGLCNDGDPCTEGDFCANGQCIPGADICNCSKNEDCADKEDGNLCNGTLVCDTSAPNPVNWQCEVNPATIVACDSSADTSCVQAECVPGTGQCIMVNVNDGLACDDLNLCTTGETCTIGLCGTGSAVTCDDNDPCTDNQCLPKSGCNYPALPDGTPCGAGGWVCAAGSCVACSCAGKDCGQDGCGNSCGSCEEEWLVCQGTQCIEPCPDLSGLYAFVGNMHYTTGTCWGEWKSDKSITEAVRIYKQGNQYEVEMLWVDEGCPDMGSYMDCSFSLLTCELTCVMNSQAVTSYYNAYAACQGEVPWVSSGAATIEYYEKDGVVQSARQWTLNGPYGTCPYSVSPTGSASGGQCDSCTFDGGQCSTDLVCLGYLNYPGFQACLPLCLSDGDCPAGFFCDTENSYCWYETWESVCDGDDVWALDECGHYVTQEDDCQWDEVCANGKCVGLFCGDGSLDADEECDDGNNEDWDGCSGDCRTEEVAVVPQGTFWMGCNQALDSQCDADEFPAHQVNPDKFAVDIYQATVQDYSECVDSGTCSTPASSASTCNWGKSGKGTHPINCISWEQADTYCDWTGMRLCTEAEWEKAARGGCALYAGDCASAMPRYPWGSTPVDCDHANYHTGSPGCGTGGTAAVGSKPLGMGPYGNLDMVGNVWDWVEDCYHSTYGGAPSDGSAWTTGCQPGHAIRGGSFWSSAAAIRASSRHQGEVGVGGFGLHVAGVRCCSDL